jgi:predicted RNA-binding protein with PUA-like domain
MAKQYWLLKSEPEEFSIDDLKRVKKEPWDGVRNYQARNYLKSMQIGDQALFYHSNTEVPGIVGIMEVASEPYPDPMAFDKKDKHYDPKSDPENPRWFLVEFKYVRHTDRTISLAELKDDAKLEDFPLTRRGNRLSVMPVTAAQWKYLLGLEKKAPKA